MRTGMLFLLLFIGSFLKAQDIDVLHYQFTLWLSNRSDTVRGKASMMVIVKKPGEATIDLTGVGKSGKGMKVHNVSLAQRGEIVPAQYTQGPEAITISTGKYNSGDTINVSISYEGVPDDGLIISKNKYGDRTFFADNWPNRAHHWIPCVDRPNDKASFEFLVHAPSEYRVISNGLCQTEDRSSNSGTTHWIEEIPSPTKVMVIGVAKFATKVFENSPAGIPVSAWVYPQDSTKGFYDYALATDILRFFSGYIGPYPYKKLANVQSKTIFGGMENANCIFYAENTVTGDRSSEDLLAHEIAHQWFGDMVSEKSFAHLWLSEGFATYLTDIYFEQKYGQEAFRKRLEKEREEAVSFARASSHAVVDSTGNLMSLLNANSYQKGAWVLHMLRGEVGDSTFQKIIREYYKSFKGSNAETRDFETVAEKVSRKELTWFFNQWLYLAGVPELRVLWEYKGNDVIIHPYGNTDGGYQLTIELTVVYEDGEIEQQTVKMWIGGQMGYSIPVKSKPQKIMFRPGSELLFVGSIAERKSR